MPDNTAFRSTRQRCALHAGADPLSATQAPGPPSAGKNRIMTTLIPGPATPRRWHATCARRSPTAASPSATPRRSSSSPASSVCGTGTPRRRVVRDPAAAPDGHVVPILRVFDEAAALSFYVDYLDFRVDWRNETGGHEPLYAQLSRARRPRPPQRTPRRREPRQRRPRARPDALDLQPRSRPRSMRTRSPGSRTGRGAGRHGDRPLQQPGRLRRGQRTGRDAGRRGTPARRGGRADRPPPLGGRPPQRAFEVFTARFGEVAA